MCRGECRLEDTLLAVQIGLGCLCGGEAEEERESEGEEGGVRRVGEGTLEEEVDRVESEGCADRGCLRERRCAQERLQTVGEWGCVLRRWLHEGDSAGIL